MKKRVLDGTKQIELERYDLRCGRLVEDTLIIAHHDASPAVEEQSHLEVVEEYPNGGRDMHTVIDVQGVDAKESYDETEEILVYLPYTVDESKVVRENMYKAQVEHLIRQQYSLSDELSILRQRESKADDWQTYNAFCNACKASAKIEMYDAQTCNHQQ